MRPHPAIPGSSELRGALLVTASLWSAGSIVYLGLTFSIGRMFGAFDAFMQLLTCALGGMVAMSLYGALRLTRAWPSWLRWPLIGAAVFAVAAAQAGMDLGLNIGVTQKVVPQIHQLYGPFETTWYLRTAFLYFWLDCLSLSLMLLSSTIEQARVQERALSEAKLAAQQAQLAALRFQLNPHFLFNTLNAISTLVMEAGAVEAEAMISKLSDFLRASLASEPGDFITLEEELETTQAYLDIESVRFGARLAVEFACAPGLGDALVPSLLLQPLVENAVKYAVAPAKRTVTIRVEATRDGDNLALVVADDGDPAEPSQRRPGTGVGLGNVRRRLEALYGAQGAVETFPGETGYLALVRMPLRRAEAPPRLQPTAA